VVRHAVASFKEVSNKDNVMDTIAKIVFFDTWNDIGVMTELMGITKEGEAQVEKMKNQTS